MAQVLALQALNASPMNPDNDRLSSLLSFGCC